MTTSVGVMVLVAPMLLFFRGIRVLEMEPMRKAGVWSVLIFGVFASGTLSGLPFYLSKDMRGKSKKKKKKNSFFSFFFFLCTWRSYWTSTLFCLLFLFLSFFTFFRNMFLLSTTRTCSCCRWQWSCMSIRNMCIGKNKLYHRGLSSRW